MHQAITATPDPASQNIFHQEADTFDLAVTLTDHKLVVTLKDYVDWVLYEKEYTQNDIGGDIHKKMDLSDVYQVFAQSTKSNDPERLQYMFGSVIENKDVSYYKIQRGGKITVYQHLMDNKKNKEIYFESFLQLAKVRHLSELEMSMIKAELKIERISKDLRDMSKAQEELGRKVNILEEENRVTRKEDQQDQLIRRAINLEENNKKMAKLLKAQIMFLILIVVVLFANFHEDASVIGSLTSQIYELDQAKDRKMSKINKQLQLTIKKIREEMLKQIQNSKYLSKRSLNKMTQDVNKRQEESAKNLKEIKEELSKAKVESGKGLIEIKEELSKRQEESSKGLKELKEELNKRQEESSKSPEGSQGAVVEIGKECKARADFDGGFVSSAEIRTNQNRGNLKSCIRTRRTKTNNSKESQC